MASPRTLSLLVRDLQGANEQLLIRSVLDQESAESAEEGRAQLNALVEAMSEGIAIADPSGRLLVLNRAACAILGVAEWSLLSTADSSLLDVRGVNGVRLASSERPIMRALRGEKFVDEEFTVVRGDGRTRELLVSGTSISDGDRVSLAVVVFRDVTDMRELERQRDEYLALISHDIRGPLSSILLLSESLKDMAARDGLRADVGDRASRIARNAQKINAMVTDLLETAGAGRGDVTSLGVSVDLASLVAGAVDLLADVARGRVHFEDACEAACVVLAEPGRLDRALGNLLSNALKYSRDPIEIRLDRRDGFAVISVTDHGVGIQSEDLSRVFDRYYRTESGLQMGGGFGLGLYITRLIVEAHGGHTEVESTLGEGSTFRLVLPLKVAQLPPPPSR